MKIQEVTIIWIVTSIVIIMFMRTSATGINNEKLNSTNVELHIKHVQKELDSLKKEDALVKFKEVLGIKGNYKEDNRIELPPQFMMELYNTVADKDGKTTRDNPYDAKIVRSFIEKDSSSKHTYIFNVTSLGPKESILEAELHLYRKRLFPKSMHPSVLSSPYYIISVYQILPDKNLEEHDSHKLLNVHYVGAYASGWQIFNVKQAVLSWLSGAPNLGLLVIATTIFGDVVTIDFFRRSDQLHNKQPILVLFNQESHSIIPHLQASFFDDDDDENGKKFHNTKKSEENEMSDEERSRKKRHDLLNSKRSGQPEISESILFDNRTYFRREKKGRRNKPRDENYNQFPKKNDNLMSRRKSIDRALTSMDIYERALLRQKLNSNKQEENQMRSENHRRRHKTGARIRRNSLSSSSITGCRKIETEPCARKELYVNFREIGLTEIIAPEGYSAYQCRGHCKPPLSQDQKPTNHATVQGIMHKMNLAPNQQIEMPCCVPVSLSSISILYHDEDRDEVVLKSYEDMVVTSCGCR